MNIIVLAKQVPDTRNVGKDAMREDGTVNRGALPAIFNPEDLNALEQALRIKDQYPDTTISVLTMESEKLSIVVQIVVISLPTVPLPEQIHLPQVTPLPWLSAI